MKGTSSNVSFQQGWPKFIFTGLAKDHLAKTVVLSGWLSYGWYVAPMEKNLWKMVSRNRSASSCVILSVDRDGWHRRRWDGLLFQCRGLLEGGPPHSGWHAGRLRQHLQHRYQWIESFPAEVPWRKELFPRCFTVMTRATFAISGGTVAYLLSNKQSLLQHTSCDVRWFSYSVISPRQKQLNATALFRLWPFFFFLFVPRKEGEGKTGTHCALDCGAGIGRITKRLLLPLFNTVDLVDVTQEFLDKAKAYLGEEGERVGNYICKGLQDFGPESGRYDVIWIQWVIGASVVSQYHIQTIPRSCDL